MRRFALATLLVLAVVGLAGCGTTSSPTITQSSKPTSSTPAASEPTTPQTGPGSDSWNQQVSAYFVQRNAIDDRGIAAYQTLMDIWNSEDPPSNAQIAKLKKDSKAYSQIVKDAEAIVPPEELKPYHALWLKTLAADRDALPMMADEVVDFDLAKMKKAEKRADASEAAQTAQDAELKRFNMTYGTDYQ
jgi:hypothetical protein